MLVDNTVNNRKPQTCTLVCFLCCKERFKNFSHKFSVHSCAVIFNREPCKTAAYVFRAPFRGTFKKHALCPDQEFTSIRHCIPCVHYEVEYYLFELALVSVNVSGFGGKFHCKFYVLADQAVKHLFHFQYYTVEVNQ